MTDSNRIVRVGFFILSMLIADNLGAQVYSVAPIPAPAGWYNITGPYSINNAGQVAASATSSSGLQQAFIGTTAGSTAIPLPAGWGLSYAYSINASGEVAGAGYNGTDNFQAFVGTTAGSTAIPVPAGWPNAYVSSDATGINSSGQVAWNLSPCNCGPDTGIFQAFIGSTAIPTGLLESWVSGINASGEVVGSGYSGPTGDDIVTFIGTTVGITVIPQPAGWVQSTAVSINDSGEVAGAGYYNGVTYLPFIGTTAGSTPIPLPAGWTFTGVNGINNLGQVIGTMVRGDGSSGIWIWDATNGTMDLQTSLPAGWTIDVYGINDKGQIVGMGDNPSTGFSGAVVLTPGPGLTIRTTTLPNVQSASPYGPISLSATGGMGGYTWSVSSVPPLPGFAINGISLTSSGNPPAPAGTYQVTLTVVDSVGNTASTTLPLVVEPLTFTFVDPNCSVAVASCQNPLAPPYSQPADVLISQGRTVQGVAADGVTELILWADSATPLTLSVGPGDGAFAAAGSNLFSGSVTVNPVSGASGTVALAVYQAPIDFVRNGSTDDAAATSRQVVMTLSCDGTTLQTFPITLVRPPVVLVHGITSNSSYWSSFAPLITDSRFFTPRADYSFSVPGTLESINPPVPAVLLSIPSLSFPLPATLPGNVLGFAYNAHTVFMQFQAYLNLYRLAAPQAGYSPVAASQVDVVGHSMGGLVTRTMAYTETQFYSPANFGQGLVHKLVTLGTPHLGSPLSIAALDPGSVCTWAGSFAIHQYTLTSAVISGTLLYGGAGDLVGDGTGDCLSPTLQLLQTPPPKPIPTSLIAGEMATSQLSALDSSPQAQFAANMRNALYFCQNDVVMQNYSSANWHVLMNTNPPACTDGTTCSDGVVPVTSALNQLTPSNQCAIVNTACDGPSQASLVLGAIHGEGTGPGDLTHIGFPEPYLQEMANVSQGVIDLLNAATNGPQFGTLSSYPDATDCPATFAGLSSLSPSISAEPGDAAKRKAATQTAAPTLTITTPANGVSVTAGQVLNVSATVSAVGGLAGIALTGTDMGWMGFEPAASSVSFSVTLPSTLPTGTYPITAMAFPSSSGGPMAISQPVNLLVQPTSTPLSLSASPSPITFNVGDMLPLLISGSMADGSTLALTTAPQMTWNSDTPAVATVTSEGVVTGVSGGTAHIAAELSGVSVTVPVTVNPPPTTPCTYILSASSATVNPLGGSSQLTVTTNLTTCSWAAVSWVPWASVTAGGTAIGSGSVSISISPNGSAASRSGNVQIAGQGFMVSQGPAPPAALLISKKHTGPFAPGQQGASYSVLVTNGASAGPTVGTMTVTETPPNGLTLVSMSGSGWTCSGNTCSRGDSLSTGTSYPAITVTGNVAGNAPSPLVNQVAVSGGGSAIASTGDPATVTSGSACDVGNAGTVTVADVQLMINQALGSAPALNDLSQDGVVNVVDVQIVVAAALGFGCSGS